MKHKGQKMLLLHPGDLARYYKEEGFKWEDIRKVAYYPEELIEDMKEEKKQITKEVAAKIEEHGQKEIELSEEELEQVVDEVLTPERIYDTALKIINQKKLQRVVINLPGWLKDKLQKKSRQTSTSMNSIVRLALTEYLSKNEQVQK